MEFDPIEMAFNAYAFHQQQIEDFIFELAATANPNDPATQIRIANEVGLDPKTLTSADIKYIEREVAKKY